MFFDFGQMLQVGYQWPKNTSRAKVALSQPSESAIPACTPEFVFPCCYGNQVHCQRTEFKYIICAAFLITCIPSRPSQYQHFDNIQTLQHRLALMGITDTHTQFLTRYLAFCIGLQVIHAIYQLVETIDALNT